MPAEFDYRPLKCGRWNLKVLAGHWSAQLWEEILRLISQQPPSRHPRTVRLEFPAGGGDRLFLKLFHPSSALATAKDCLRESRAFRALRQGVALARAGFSVPMAVAGGEERFCRVLRRAFLLTLGTEGEPLPAFLGRHFTGGLRGVSLAQKRAALNGLGKQIRRLHELGFVHGDLVASNFIVTARPEGGIDFCLIDNDRTRHYPRWLPQTLWKRNLVQLNRLPLPGITLQDRMRFFRAYARAAGSARAEHALLRWLERKTRERRRAIDAADTTVSFRRLMRWEHEAAENV